MLLAISIANKTFCVQDVQVHLASTSGQFLMTLHHILQCVRAVLNDSSKWRPQGPFKCPSAAQVVHTMAARWKSQRAAAQAKRRPSGPKRPKRRPRGVQEACNRRPRGVQETSKFAQEASKLAQMASKSRPKAAKRRPRAGKFGPTGVQEAFKSGQERPRGVQERTRGVQEASKSGQERPRGVQEASKSARERSRASQERPKSVPRARQERAKSVQERLGRLARVVKGCKWLLR